MRRTIFAVGFAAALGRRLRGQSRGELTRMRDEQLAASQFKSAEIMRLDAASATRILENANSSEFQKAKACQRLALVGDDSAIPALAALLQDPKLSHYARTALEPMPGDAADRALRQALEKVDGDLLIGLINSIAVRRDPHALVALAGLRQGDDREVSKAATAAISRIRRP